MSLTVSIKYILTFMFILSFVGTQGQSEIPRNTRTNQIWLDFNPSYNLDEHFTVYGDVAVRSNLSSEWTRLILGPSIKYTLPKPIFNGIIGNQVNEVHTGLRIFKTFNSTFSNRLEVRMFQGYSLLFPLTKRFDFQAYLRLEERFDFNTEDWVNTFGFRLRILTSFTYQFKGNLWEENKKHYLLSNVELFLNLIDTKQFNDLIRLNLGFGRRFNDIWRAELVYGNFLTRITAEDSFQTEDIVYRLRVYYRILDGKKRKHKMQNKTSSYSKSFIF